MSVGRRWWRTGALLPVLLACLVLAGCLPALRTPTAGWHLSWRSENVFVASTSTVTSCRFLARLSGFGSRLRAEFGAAPGSRGFPIVAASVALPLTPTSLDLQPGSSRRLTFGGQPGVRVNGGASVVSDPLALPIRPGTPVLVTVTAGPGDASTKGGRTEPAACATGQPAAVATTGSRAFPAPAGVRWLRSLQVDGPAQRSIVALGDSITEQTPFAPPGSYLRWTDALAANGLLVANAGVTGGAVSRYGLFGTLPGTERARSLLAQPQVNDLVVLLGTNDLASGSSGLHVLVGLENVINQAKQRGVAAWVGTIPPRSNREWTARQESERRAVNAQLRGSWLTSRGARLVDTDLALRDPASAGRLLPAYDSGDRLHPNAAGERRIAETVRAALGPINVPTVPPVVPPTVPPKPTPTLPVPTPTPTPTSSPEPSVSPSPSEGPVTPAPSDTLVPSETPAPTETPEPSETPAPTETPTPSATPAPTETPTPSETPEPTVSPEPGSEGGPPLDPSSAELAPATTGFLLYRATAPAAADWTW